jgi:23S rRNA (uracil1939-C5)-methyltransferase
MSDLENHAQPCRHRPECSGCPLFEKSEDAQIERKREIIRRALDAYPSLSALTIRAFHAAPESLFYRNRARMVATDSPVPSEKLGFYQAGSREILPIERCVVHHPDAESVVDVIRTQLPTHTELDAFTRFIDVRTTAGFGADQEAAIVTFGGAQDGVSMGRVHEQVAELAETVASAVDHEVSTHLNISDAREDAVLAGRQKLVRGEDAIDYDVSGHRFRVPPTAFFQMNCDQLEAAHRRMRDELSGRESVLVDLYSGVGVHGIALAESRTRIVGFDSSDEAVGVARLNAAFAELEHEYLAASDDAVADWILNQVGDDDALVVTNPARAGMGHEVLYALEDIRADRILYLSCEPRTLARDADRLGAIGYECAALEAFDFLPRTEQVELLAIFQPADAPRPSRYERAHRPKDERTFSEGVSGPTLDADSLEGGIETEWVALVKGQTPGHGFLPQVGSAQQSRVQIDKLRNVGENCVIRLTASKLDDRQIRERLRRWNHPVIGDPEFGDRQANHVAEREDYLDRIALHCVRASVGDTQYFAPVPGGFLALMRLPRAVLENTG